MFTPPLKATTPRAIICDGVSSSTRSTIDTSTGRSMLWCPVCASLMLMPLSMTAIWSKVPPCTDRSACTSPTPRVRTSTAGSMARMSPTVRTKECCKSSAVSTAAGSGVPNRLSAANTCTSGRVRVSRSSSACAMAVPCASTTATAATATDLRSWRSAMYVATRPIVTSRCSELKAA